MRPAPSSGTVYDVNLMRRRCPPSSSASPPPLGASGDLVRPQRGGCGESALIGWPRMSGFGFAWRRAIRLCGLMTRYGFHASHEQIPGPTAAGRRTARGAGGVRRRHVLGPLGTMVPVRQGHWQAWTWLGAALATTGLPLGVVNAPGQRYHPAIIAQAAATLAAMFPGRFWVALGSGENVNEHITGGRWPAKAERDARLRECVGIIRALLDGEEVTHDGLVTVDRAKLWTLSRREAAAHRPRGDACDGPLARRLGGRDGHGEPVAGGPEAGRGRVPGCGRARRADPAGARVVGARRGDRAGRGPGPDGRPGVRAAGRVGPGHPCRRSTPLGTHVGDDALRRSVLVDHDPARLADRVSDWWPIGLRRGLPAPGGDGPRAQRREARRRRTDQHAAQRDPRRVRRHGRGASPPPS